MAWRLISPGRIRTAVYVVVSSANLALAIFRSIDGENQCYYIAKVTVVCFVFPDHHKMHAKDATLLKCHFTLFPHHKTRVEEDSASEIRSSILIFFLHMFALRRIYIYMKYQYAKPFYTFFDKRNILVLSKLKVITSI